MKSPRSLAALNVFLPLAYLLRDSWFYRVVIVRVGSVAVVIVACIWFLERSAGIAFW